MDNFNSQMSSASDRAQSPVPSEASTRISTGLSSAQYLHQHGASTRLPNPPTFIKWQGMQFLIMDAPSESNIELYIREMKKYNVTDVVRVCDPTYSREIIEREGIRLYEMLFPDGDGPSDSIVDKWMHLMKISFPTKESSSLDEEASSSSDNNNNNNTTNSTPTIAVHCVAGLGRAPVLVAIALIEAGMSPLDAISFLRERRRGAINSKQLCYLESYKCRSKSPSLKCLIM